MKPSMNMKTISAILAISTVMSLTLGVQWANAQATGSHGGDVLILPDQSVVLADPYAVKAGPASKLNPVLIKEIERAGRFLRIFGESSDFLAQQVFNPRIEFRFVDQFPSNITCDRVETVVLPSGAQKMLAGCTEGMVTWILDDLFKHMSIREQTLLIIHERLHALPVKAAHDFITDITNGLRVSFYLDDQEAAGNRVQLSQNEVDRLTQLNLRLFQLELAPHSFEELSLMVDAHGGGIRSRNARDQVSDTAYFGFGSKTISETSALLGSNPKVALKVGDQVSILNSDLLVHEVGANVSILNSHVAATAIGDSVQIENSKIGGIYVYGPSIGANTHILNSELSQISAIGSNDRIYNVKATSFSVLDDSELVDSKLGVFEGSNRVSVKQVLWPQAIALTLRDGAHLEQVSVSFAGTLMTPYDPSQFSASKILILAEGASIENIAPTRVVWDDGIQLTVEAKTNLDFQNQMICQDPKREVWLNAEWRWQSNYPKVHDMKGILKFCKKGIELP